MRPEASRTAKSMEGSPTPVASCTEWSASPSPSHRRITRAWLPEICLLGPPPFFHHLPHPHTCPLCFQNRPLRSSADAAAWLCPAIRRRTGPGDRVWRGKGREHVALPKSMIGEKPARIAGLLACLGCRSLAQACPAHRHVYGNVREGWVIGGEKAGKMLYSLAHIQPCPLCASGRSCHSQVRVCKSVSAQGCSRFFRRMLGKGPAATEVGKALSNRGR